MKRGDKNFFVNAFVHFYQHDYKFDGARCGIWFHPKRAAEIFRHFAGIITPDFSTNLDFPFPWKIFNTYRMRAFGYWYSTLGGAVINNVRWGAEDTFIWTFEGIPHNSIVSTGTVASGFRNSENRELFETGFFKMIAVLRPHTIIVYGSDKYPCFDSIRQQIRIVQFDSERALAFKEKSHV